MWGKEIKNNNKMKTSLTTPKFPSEITFNNCKLPPIKEEIRIKLRMKCLNLVCLKCRNITGNVNNISNPNLNSTVIKL